VPNFYVTVNRPSITAATPQAAADISISTPLRSSDITYVKELAEDEVGVTFEMAGATFKVTTGETNLNVSGANVG
jgi:hypothetical protein